jgi:hypothetical protein
MGQALSKAVYFFRWKSAAIFIPPQLIAGGFILPTKELRVTHLFYDVKSKSLKIL